MKSRLFMIFIKVAIGRQFIFTWFAFMTVRFGRFNFREESEVDLAGIGKLSHVLGLMTGLVKCDWPGLRSIRRFGSHSECSGNSLTPKLSTSWTPTTLHNIPINTIEINIAIHTQQIHAKNQNIFPPTGCCICFRISCILSHKNSHDIKHVYDTFIQHTL